MDNDSSGTGRVVFAIDSTGYTGLTVTFKAKTSSLENGDSCKAWWSSDSGSTWTEFWSHTGGSELGWTTVAMSGISAVDDNSNVQIRFGVDQPSGSADYCWMDSLTADGSPGSSSTPAPQPVTPTPAPQPVNPSPGGGGCAGCLGPSSYDPLSGDGAVARTELSSSVLFTGSGMPTSVLNFEHMTVPANAAMPTESFEGHLSLPLVATETPNFVKIKDSFNYDSDAERLHMPPVELDLIQHGSHLIPSVRGTRDSSHPFWEVAVEPGRCWEENGDNGDTRCSLPFALTQKNSNCVHNGVLTFVFGHTGSTGANDGVISNVWYQIASETCLYYKFNFAGHASATYTHEVVPLAASLRSSYEAEVAARMTSKPLSEVSIDIPGANANNLVPSNTAEHVSMYGFVYNDIHYRDFGPTRVPNSGPYPYEDGLILPSYSTAKTFFLSAALMALKEAYPNESPSVYDATVGSLLTSAPSSKWDDVTLQNVVDMATGNYRFANYLRDEGLTAVENNFFLVESHVDKLDHALNYYSRKATPGATWVYHTSDTYVGLAAAQEWLRSASNDSTASILSFMINNVWSPMGGSEVLFNSRTTYDSVDQPFGGYGLFLLPSDFARIMDLFNSKGGVANGAQAYDQASLSTAVENDCNNDCGLQTSFSGYDLYYKSGLWKKQPAGACEFVVYGSGYGGISTAMMPGGSSYFVVSDNDEYSGFDSPAVDALSIEGTW